MDVSTGGIAEANRSDTAPYHVVCVLSDARPAGKQRLPVVFAAESDGTVRVVTEVLEWARASLFSRDLSTVQREVETVGRFIDFCRALGDCISFEEGDLDYVVYAYLLWRKNGTRDDRGRQLLDGLSWKPLDSARLQQEFRTLARFFSFCAERFGFVRLNDKAYRQSSESTPVRRMFAYYSRSQDDFLIHLGASREFWSQRTQPGNPVIPPITSMRSPSTRAGFRMSISDEEIWAIIAAERNPVFRGLWLVGAFGGPRISEQLNFWQIDVLPAACHLPLFGYENNETILVLRADPYESRYTESLARPGLSRRQYLQVHYGGHLLPRPEYEEGHPLRAGWKGTRYANEHLSLLPVFWIDLRAAKLFEECAAEIRHFHARHGTSRKHPFFYVNMSDPTGEHRGGMLKMSNVQSAWNRACLRCKLEPHRWGRNLHGQRHFYKEYAKHELHLPKEYRQVMLGHLRLDSQEDYGRSARRINDNLTSIYHSFRADR